MSKIGKDGEFMRGDEPLGLKFALLDRKFKKQIESKASDLGFTAVQLSVLAEITHMESIGVEEINQKDLEEVMKVTHPTMTEIIKRLEKKHAIICEPSKKDKRSKKITSTGEYGTIYLDLITKDEEIFQEITKEVSEEERNIFLKTLDKMLDCICPDKI